MGHEADAELALVLTFLRKWGHGNPLPEWKKALLAAANLLEIHMHRIENLDTNDVKFVEETIAELIKRRGN